jgi:hypothetical protein
MMMTMRMASKSKGSARREHMFLYFDVKCASSLARSELGEMHGRTHRAKQHAVCHADITTFSN